MDLGMNLGAVQTEFGSERYMTGYYMIRQAVNKRDETGGTCRAVHEHDRQYMSMTGST